MKNKFLILDNDNILGVLELDIKKPIIKQLKKIFTYEYVLNKLGEDIVYDLELWESYSISFIKLLDSIQGKSCNIYEISIYGDNGVKILEVIDINNFKKFN
jgi:hypothetical protein